MTVLDYRLSAEELQRWTSSLGPASKKRGTKTRLADALYREKVAEHSSCKNMVTDFFKGKPDALRGIFDDPVRLRIMAEGLGLTPDILRDYLMSAKTAGKDPPFSRRLPGFEDLGAFDIVDVAFSPPAGKKIIVANGVATSVSDGVSSWSFDDLFELATSDDPNLAITIFIVGPDDDARELCLQWLRAKLRQVDVRISDWRRADLEEGAIVLQPDFDRLTLREQSRLLSIAANKRAILFATASIHVPAEDQCGDRVVLLLDSGSAHWALRYLDHLDQLLARHGHVADLEPVKRWIEDDPRSGWVVDGVDALGLVARHAFDGGEMPFSNRLLVERSSCRAAERLRTRGRGGDALFLETCGNRALGLVAAIACRKDEAWISMEEVARCFVDAADGIAGKAVWRSVGAAGVLSVVDGLIDVGLLRRRGSLVTISRTQLLVAALGFYIADNLEDSEVIRAAVLREQWHPSLLAAAEACGDPSRILAAIERQSVGVRHASAPAVTWVLGSGSPPTDRQGFARAFLLTLRWWAMHPQKPAPRTLTLGSSRPTVPASPTPIRIGGRDPLVALGQISQLYRGELPRGWTAVDLLNLELDVSMDLLENPESGAQCDEQAFRLALMIGAPYQSLEILAPDLWACMPRSGDVQAEINYRLCQEDHALWWRTVAAPRLLLDRDGKARVACVHPGHSIWSAMRQNPRGTRIWADALYECMRDGMGGSDEIFIEAMQNYASRGGRWNQDGLDGIWQRLSEQLRAELRPRVAARLCEGEPWMFDERGVTWMMKTFLAETDLSRLWDDWSSRDGVVSLYLPWRSFLDAGVDADRILRWALATIGDQQDHAIEPMSEAATGWLAAQFHQPAHIPQEAALGHLLSLGDARLLARLRVFAPHAFAKEAGRLLVKFPREETREAMLGVCDDSSTPHEIRSRILTTIHPRPGEADRWSRFAELSLHPINRIAHQCQVDCARAEDHGRWRSVCETLELLESLVEDPERHREFIQQFVSEIDAEQMAAVAVDVCSNLLTYIGSLLARTRSHVDERGPVVEHVLATPSLRKLVLGGVHAPWWALALELHREEKVLAWLRAGHADDPQATRARLGSVVLPEAATWAAIADPDLGPLLAGEFAAQRRSTNIEVAASNLGRLESSLNLDAVHDLARCYVIAGGGAAARVFQDAMRTSGATSEEIQCFWKGVARGLSDPVALAAVIDQLTLDS